MLFDYLSTLTALADKTLAPFITRGSLPKHVEEERQGKTG